MIRKARDVIETAAIFTAFAGLVGAFGGAAWFVGATFLAPAVEFAASVAPTI